MARKSPRKLRVRGALGRDFLLYDTHFGPVVGELATAIETDDIVSGGGGSDGFPIADGACWNRGRGCKRLGSSAMTAGKR